MKKVSISIRPPERSSITLAHSWARTPMSIWAGPQSLNRSLYTFAGATAGFGAGAAGIDGSMTMNLPCSAGFGAGAAGAGAGEGAACLAQPARTVPTNRITTSDIKMSFFMLHRLLYMIKRYVEKFAVEVIAKMMTVLHLLSQPRC